MAGKPKIVHLTYATDDDYCYIHTILRWVESQPDPIVFSILVVLYILVSLPIAWGYIVINAATG